MPIDYMQFIHPEDKEAMQKLQAIPLLDTAVKKMLELITEDLLHGINLASYVQISTRQMPKLYSLLEEVCQTLQIPIPEFYLAMNPNPNAYTCGDTVPFVVVNSGIIDLLDENELKAVIAHECGHILCRHVLYHTLATFLVSGSSFLGSLAGVGLISEPLKWALMYWVRRSEYSADRVAAYVMNEPKVVAQVMMRLAGGPSKIVGNINMDLFLEQAAEYDKFIRKSGKSKLLQNWEVKDLSHPYPVLRAAEVLKWYRSYRPQMDMSYSNDQLKW